MQRTFKTMTDINIKEGLKVVLDKIAIACEKRAPELQYATPRLVAVGKTKPVELIVEAYDAGQRHFGENYVQELEEKANHPIILEKCTDIKWHFIGHLQSNKVNKVLSVPNLFVIETVHKQKLAANLNNHWSKFRMDDSKLKVFIQVNTSGEDVKNGVPPSEVTSLTKYILSECGYLELEGLMTIGKYGYNPEDGPNPDFLTLIKCREDVCKSLGLDWKKFHLSMGMSTDYEQAVELGSTNVRVGSNIFGYREPKKSKE